MIKELNLFATLNPIDEGFEEKWKQLGDSLKMLSHGPVDVEIVTTMAEPNKVQWNEVPPNRPSAFGVHPNQNTASPLAYRLAGSIAGTMFVPDSSGPHLYPGKNVSGSLHINGPKVDVRLTEEAYNFLVCNTDMMTGKKFVFVD